MNAVAVDEYTLDVVTAAPAPILPSRVYFSLLVSMKLLKEMPDQYPVKLIVACPDRFLDWVKCQHVKLEVSPDWWGHTAAGAATIKNVSFLPRTEHEVRGRHDQDWRGRFRALAVV